jgi:hypothetical protein
MVNGFQELSEFRPDFRTDRKKYMNNLDLQHREKIVNLISTQMSLR